MTKLGTWVSYKCKTFSYSYCEGGACCKLYHLNLKYFDFLILLSNMLSEMIILSACLFSITLASKPGSNGKSICTPIFCISGTLCIETTNVPICVRKFGTSKDCAFVSCRDGTTCIETLRGGICIPSRLRPCIHLFQPVCCMFKNGEEKTAANSCECDGYILSKGECESKPCICTKEANPVCCKTDKGFKIEGNPCVCIKCESGQVVAKSNCSEWSKCNGKRYQVCCKLDNRVRKVRNKCGCECRCGSVVKWYRGKCMN